MVIIPIGACEQHGPHLPLAVDTIDCYEVAKRVSAKAGGAQSHGHFPGTLSIRPETMIRMICDIVEWLYRSGIRKILLLNGHMWDWGPIYSARENIHYDFPDIQVNHSANHGPIHERLSSTAILRSCKYRRNIMHVGSKTRSCKYDKCN